MTEPDHEQHVDPPADHEDAESLREYGRQLAMDNLIRDALSAAEGGQQGADAPPAEVLPMSRTRRVRVWWTAAAACLVGVLGLAIWRSGDGPHGGDIATLDPRWSVSAGAGADYRVVAPGRVELRRGELRFASGAPAHLVVETPHAVATAEGTEFLIGHHPDTDDIKTQKENAMKRRETTRILVLSGVVSMATGHGRVAAGAGEVAVAEAGAAPEKIAVRANSQFAFGLYRQLAAENAGENMFFSPYSVSNALLMAAEGARGQTAAEMGEVLGLPDGLRRRGEEAQQIPWEIGKMHVGLATLNRLFNRDHDTPEQKRLHAQEAELERRLTEAKKSVKATGGDAAREEERELVAELNALRQKIDTLELSVANALWGERRYPFAEDYVKTVGPAYSTGAMQEADFMGAPENERQRINAWVSERTNDRIKDLLPEGSVDEMTRLVLTNAIFFKADWEQPFAEGDTRDADFVLASGDKVQARLMRQRASEGARYAAFEADGSPFETPVEVPVRGEGPPTSPGPDGFSMVELPYRGGEVSMLVIAPNSADGLAAIEDKLDGDTLEKWVGGLARRDVHVHLPKFKMDTSYRLKDSLTAMGMPTAFVDSLDPDGADFSGMTGSASADPLYISTVIHKAFVEVNEAGTEAAAATAVSMAPRGIPETVPFTPTFRADRPFVYLIREVETGTVLFMGRVTDPDS